MTCGCFVLSASGLKNSVISVLPVSSGDDLRLLRQVVHHIHPCRNRAAVLQRRRDQLPVVEPGVTLQPIHRGPVGAGDLDQLRLDCAVVAGHEGGEAPAGVVERASDRAGANADGVPAVAVVAFSGHQRSVGDDLDGVHGFASYVVDSARRSGDALYITMQALIYQADCQ